jgi:hypothetical protein
VRVEKRGKVGKVEEGERVGRVEEMEGWEGLVVSKR